MKEKDRWELFREKSPLRIPLKTHFKIIIKVEANKANMDVGSEGVAELNCIQFTKPEVSGAKALPSVAAMEFPWMVNSID
ncbi:hypothetical protein [Limisalsivibrio acetivorans]|uniref:hypothetical protein n=1 Tax=Limisalsivibrio acetivorans TaxID=1304888 RepID=UPI0003B73DF0|nr:hypothetical protein [Limisalsivibrio acetivorans]